MRQYFAAANSFDGFVSYFDKIFPSEEFDRVFLLKGGPGTGKSSLMRKISAAMHADGYEVDEILCSSDPNSLDGIVVKGNNRKIAMLDSTSPHERGANIPGAIDEIINLGENWDTKWLQANKSDIVTKIRQKAFAYKSAYNSLKSAGVCHKQIYSCYESYFNKSKTKNWAEAVLNYKTIPSNEKSIHRLLSSFGRNGYLKLPYPDDENVTRISISGDDYSASILINELYQLLLARNTDMVLYHSAPDTLSLDAIEIPKQQILICKGDNGDINANDFISLGKLEEEYLRFPKRIKAEAMEDAQRWFLVASNLHFDLEKIYIQAMDFDKNQQIFSEKLAEIKNILEN